MPRYHISALGKPAVCKAQADESCPLGGSHFKTPDEATFFIELHPDTVAEHTTALKNLGLNMQKPLAGQAVVVRQLATERKSELSAADRALVADVTADEERRNLAALTFSHPSSSVRDLDDAELSAYHNTLMRYNKAKTSSAPEVFLNELPAALEQLKTSSLSKYDYSHNTEGLEQRMSQEIERHDAVLTLVGKELLPRLSTAETRLQHQADTNPVGAEQLADKAAAVRHFRNHWAIAVVEAGSFDGIKDVLTSFDIDQFTPPEAGSRAARPGWQEGLKLARNYVNEYLI